MQPDHGVYGPGRTTRRRNIALLCVAVVLLSGLVDIAVLTVTAGPLRRLAGIGGGSICGSPTDDRVRSRGHRPDGTRISYATVPPSSGPHWPVPAPAGTWFYDRGTAPPVETLVHNLEHGYTIIWYDGSVTGSQLSDLRTLAGQLGARPGKVIAAPWDTAHGRFPSGGSLALAHWGAGRGHREFCPRVDARSIRDFAERFPSGDSPEPGGA